MGLFPLNFFFLLSFFFSFEHGRCQPHRFSPPQLRQGLPPVPCLRCPPGSHSQVWPHDVPSLLPRAGRQHRLRQDQVKNHFEKKTKNPKGFFFFPSPFFFLSFSHP